MKAAVRRADADACVHASQAWPVPADFRLWVFNGSIADDQIHSFCFTAARNASARVVESSAGGVGVPALKVRPILGHARMLALVCRRGRLTACAGDHRVVRSGWRRFGRGVADQ
jgi:hypothetical protein